MPPAIANVGARAYRRNSWSNCKKPSYPARNPQQNVADLKAQIAANEKNVAELKKAIGPG